MADDTVPPVPNLALVQHRFVLSQPRLAHLHDAARESLKHGIAADHMAPWLAHDSLLAAAVDPSGALAAQATSENQSQLDQIQAKLDDAQNNLGESEISEAIRSRASYLARIGDTANALVAHETALEKSAGLGAKIDLRLTMIRIGLFAGDHSTIASNMAACRTLIESGGDWDRRNRLKAYEAVYCLSIRQFKKAAILFFDTLSTFTATELIDYTDYVALAIISGVLSLDRKDLKNKLVNGTEVIQTLPDLPHLKDYAQSFYSGDYATFFKALAEVEEHHLLVTRILAPHARYYVTEMRIKAYSQLLESYQSVTLANLSLAFGVSEAFLDRDLSKFISASKLNCAIDRVNGVVETNRADVKNAHYEQAIKQGDVLLNSVQKLARVLV